MLNNTFLPGYLSQSENFEELPTQSDVVIIGGGLLGTALSYYLAKSGVEVTLLERNDLNREASGTNAGSFHFQIALHQLTDNMTDADDKRLAEETKLMLDAAMLWDDIEKELDADLGVHFTQEKDMPIHFWLDQLMHIAHINLGQRFAPIVKSFESNR